MNSRNHGGTARTSFALYTPTRVGVHFARMSQGPSSSVFLPGLLGTAPSDFFLSPQTTGSVPWGGGELTAVCGDSGLPLWLHPPQL